MVGGAASATTSNTTQHHCRSHRDGTAGRLRQTSVERRRPGRHRDVSVRNIGSFDDAVDVVSNHDAVISDGPTDHSADDHDAGRDNGDEPAEPDDIHDAMDTPVDHMADDATHPAR
ncbi:MAG: hypothetical protein CL424_18550 [Acidimicrobiaceae bacterium]|nr:hypothetical protein [Acidimicrobiaceae bacterium]